MTVNTTQYTQFLVNVSSVQNQSFPNVFPSISIPPSVLITIIIVVLIVVSLSVVLNTRRQTAASAEFENEAELEKQRGEVADILDRTASELRQGGEYRRSVLECYRRICEILESKSKIDARPLTAREFESSVSFRLKLDTPYLSQITDIFEIARYSPHEISKADADAAINCLTNLSSVLREIKNSSDEGRK